MQQLRLCCVCWSLLSALTVWGADNRPVPGDRVFEGTPVVSFHLTLDEKQFAALAPAGGFRPGPPGFGPPRPQADGTHRNTFGVDFPWVQGDLEYDGETFSHVGIRCKGNYTYMASARSLKKPLKIDLNRHVKRQKLDGLTMLNLHSGVSDPTRTRESLSYAFFREAGVPAPRTTLAELTLTVPGKHDREFVGVYTLVEQVNKTFLSRHFGDGTGLLLKPEGLQGGLGYRGEQWQQYADQYQPEPGSTAEQQQRLIDFTRLIDEGTEEEFARDLGGYLAIDEFLRFIAANTLLSNLDSYLGYGHNYCLYLVPGTGKFVFIPWDLDLSLATWPAVGTPEQLVKLSIHHPHAGENRLIDRLFAIPEQKARYLEILRELCATCFTPEALLAHLENIEEALEGPLKKETQAVKSRNEGRGGGPFGGGEFGQSMPPRKFIRERTESVAAQLAGEASGFEPKPFGPGFGGPPPGGGRGPRPPRR